MRKNAARKTSSYSTVFLKKFQINNFPNLFLVFVFSQKSSSDGSKQELISLRQKLESYQSRINQLESLLDRNVTSEKADVKSKVRTNPLIDDESSKDDDNDDNDSNMVDLTNIPERSPSPIGFSTQQFSTTSSAIDILHSIIQQTTTTLDLPEMKKMKVRKLDDETEENHDYLVRPFVQNQRNFQRTFNKFGGHSMPLTRRISHTSFKSKTKSTKSRPSTSTTSTRNNHKITTFFDLN